MQGLVGSTRTEVLSSNRLSPGSSCRLLLQPRSFEGLGTVEVLLDAACFAVLDHHDVREFHFHRRPAVSPVPSKPGPDEQQIAIRANLEWLDVEVGIGVKPALMLLAYRVESLIDGMVGVLSGIDELAIRMPRRRRLLFAVEPLVASPNQVLVVRPLGRAEVATFPSRVDRAHEIEVLRHRYSDRPTAPSASPRVEYSSCSTIRPSRRVSTEKTVACTYSIFGSDHAVELKSPRSE